jgi:type III secretion system FlhB-like substrate exporter
VELAGLKSERSQTMTDTINDVTVQRGAEEEPALAAIDEQGVAEQLVAQAREKGIELVGPDGLLSQLTKRVLEAALEVEMTDHLGYGKHDRSAAIVATRVTESGPRRC